jgi:hypothetical protein
MYSNISFATEYCYKPTFGDDPKFQSLNEYKPTLKLPF